MRNASGTKRISFLYLLILLTVPAGLVAQDCSIISKANDIIPDRLCSPVSVEWEVSVRGVNDGGSSVQIQYEWGDGSVEVYDAVNVNSNISVREWSFTANHTYTSRDDRCNYHPVATLMVDGQLCSSSAQEQIVTVWDNDSRNGGRLSIQPSVYPICFGNGDNVRFQDRTRFNCVPPQERDVPNNRTRWIQWIYGTANTMTGSPVTINGTPQSFPYSGSIQKLEGPVTGSGIWSETMNVADDKFIGQYFQVTLRYWNYCNPYDDPLIPGPPADPVNGDNAPVTTTARILIVPLPDAEITPVPPVCIYSDTLFLQAATRGGQWSGEGIVDSRTGAFYPPAAGTGDHIILYEITDGNNCGNQDTVVIKVRPGPEVRINPPSPQCFSNPPLSLSATGGKGIWSGKGIISPYPGMFDPATADTGTHILSFTTEPDENGCVGKGQTEIIVRKAPEAEILTADSSWCENNESAQIKISIRGSSETDYNLYSTTNTLTDSIMGFSSDTLVKTVYPTVGKNRYTLNKITGNFPEISCSRNLNDSLTQTVHPLPDMSLSINTNGICHPVDATFNALPGEDNTYVWSCGNQILQTGPDSVFSHQYKNTGLRDTSYTLNLTTITPFGCTDSTRYSLRVFPLPAARFLSEDDAWCKGEKENIALIGISGMEEMTYQLDWEYNSEPQTTENIDSDTLKLKLPTPTGANTCQLTGITGFFPEGSCSRLLKDSLQTEIYPLPEMQLLISPNGYCSPVSAELAASHATNQQYIWDFDDGGRVQNDTAFAYHSFYNYGTRDTVYNVKLTIRTDKSCTDSIRMPVYVYPNPVADFSVAPIEQHYPDSLVHLINYSSPGEWSYHWSFGDGKNSKEKQPMTHNYATWGKYDIQLKTYSDYCSDSISKTIQIQPPPPEASFSPDTSGCAPLFVRFENQSIYGDYYFWDFDDGSYSNEKNPSHTFLSRKAHQVKLTVTGPSGWDESTQTITVYPDPVVDFTVFPEEGTRTDQLFKFLNKTQGAVRYLWDFGDGNISEEKEPSHIFGQEGEFPVTLYAWNEFNCTDTLIRQNLISVIEGTGKLRYPNVFRWNGSGPTGGQWKEGEIDNTVFHPHFINVTEYLLRIYSRWGELLYESDDLYKGWDGYFNDGSLAPQGVYVYKVLVTFVDGSREIKVGDITFLH